MALIGLHHARYTGRSFPYALVGYAITTTHTAINIYTRAQSADFPNLCNKLYMCITLYSLYYLGTGHGSVLYMDVYRSVYQFENASRGLGANHIRNQLRVRKVDRAGEQGSGLQKQNTRVR